MFMRVKGCVGWEVRGIDEVVERENGGALYKPTSASIRRLGEWDVMTLVDIWCIAHMVGT
jgi:hypothetical protein